MATSERKAFVIDTDAFLRQSYAASTMAAQMHQDTLLEIECWRMFGIQADWDFPDCLRITLPTTKEG